MIVLLNSFLRLLVGILISIVNVPMSSLVAVGKQDHQKGTSETGLAPGDEDQSMCI